MAICVLGNEQSPPSHPRTKAGAVRILVFGQDTIDGARNQAILSVVCGIDLARWLWLTS